MLKTFKGFKGKMAAAQIGHISFVILAKNDRELDTLWRCIVDAPLDHADIKSCILIESATLPDSKSPCLSASVVNPNPDALDRLNASLAQTAELEQS